MSDKPKRCTDHGYCDNESACEKASRCLRASPEEEIEYRRQAGQLVVPGRDGNCYIVISCDKRSVWGRILSRYTVLRVSDMAKIENFPGWLLPRSIKA